MRQSLVALFVIPTIIALSACGGGSSGSTEDAFTRIIHAHENSGAIDLEVQPESEDSLDFSNISFRQSTGYISVPAGNALLNLFDSETDDLLVDDQPTSLTGGRSYSFLFSNIPGVAPLQTIVDERFVAAGGRVRLRIINSAPSANRVDLYIVEAANSIEGRSPFISNVDLGTVSAYSEFSAGNYRLVVTTAGTKDDIVSLGPLNLDPGQVRSLLLVDAEGGGLPLGTVFLNDLR